MTDGSQASPLSLDLRIQLAGCGDALRRWYRLRRLWNELQSADDYSTGEMEQLVAALEASFDDAAGEAETVAAILEANAEQINAMFAAGTADTGKPEDVRRYFGNPDSDDARRLAGRLRELPARRADEADLLRGGLGEGEKKPVPAIGATAFCTIAETVFFEDFAGCMGGSDADCKHAAEVLNDLLVHCPLPTTKEKG